MKRKGNTLVAWAIVLLMLFLNGAARAQNAPLPDTLDEKEGVSVPFEYDPPAQPYIIVKVTLNGSKPQRFVVDTGVNVAMILDTNALVALGLKAKGGDIPFNSGRAKVQEVVVKDVGLYLNELKGDAAELPLNTAYATDLSPINYGFGSNKITGILGLPVLQESTVRFDFDHRRMVFFFKPNAHLKLSKATTLTLHPENGFCFIDMATKGQKYKLLLDTGAEGTTLPFAIASHLSPSATMTNGSAGIGDTEITVSMRLPRFKIGDFEETNIEVNTAPDGEPVTLGIDVLSHYILTMDYRNSQLHLQRSASYVQNSHMSGDTGINLAVKDGLFVVKTVELASSADKAGVKVGDVIKFIDGCDARTLTLQSGQALLSGYSGSQAALEISRNGKEQNFRIDRRDRFANRNRPDYGVLLFREAGKPFLVNALLEGGQAQKAGLQIDDEVVTLNGGKATDASLEQLRTILDAPEMKIEVKRKGAEKPLTVTLKRGVQPK